MSDVVLSPRLRIPALGLFAGLILGAAAWAALATGAADQQRLETDQVTLSRLKPPSRAPSIVGALVADATAHPLFNLTTGPGAQPEPVILVSGLSRTPVHRAALLSVDGKAAAWLNVGQSMGGVTLLDVQSSDVIVETPFGRKDVDLSDQISAPSTSSPSPEARTAGPALPPGLPLHPPGVAARR